MILCKQCGCEKKGRYKDICLSCYNKNNFQSIKSKECSTCGISHKQYGINCCKCSRELRISKEPIIPCSVCARTNIRITHKKLIMCTTCYRHKLENEIPGLKESRILYNRQSHRKYRGKEPFGPLQHAPAGSGYINKYGYKIITKKGHPNQMSDKGAIQEHVFVMSEYLCRPIKKGETIHHKNGIRDDNRIENLELWSTAQPYGQRVEDKITWCKEFLAAYDK